MTPIVVFNGFNSNGLKMLTLENNVGLEKNVN